MVGKFTHQWNDVKVIVNCTKQVRAKKRMLRNKYDTAISYYLTVDGLHFYPDLRTKYTFCFLYFSQNINDGKTNYWKLYYISS